MKNNKKGISAIVATVMIILITVAAVTIVWAAIIPMIGNQLETATVCVDAVSQLQLADSGYTCYNPTNLSLQVKRGATDFDLAEIQVLVSAGGSTTSYELINETSGVLPKANEQRVYVITGITGTPESVQIAPIITIGNTQKTCDVSSTVKLKACAL